MADQGARTEYAILVTGDEAPSSITPDRLMTTRGELFWVLREPGGWVPATSTRVNVLHGLPHDLLTFSTRAEATAFATEWKGHPWWCIPIAHSIIAVRQKFKRVPDGYEEVPVE
jgi:hypothetical protein